MEKVHNMMITTQVLEYHQTAAVLIVAQLNKVSSTKANNEVIPQKKLYGNKSCLDAIQIFGCTNYVHNKTYQTKIKSKAMVCKFVGYNKTSKIDRCFDPIKIKVILSQDIQFDKKNVWSNISSQIDKNQSGIFLYQLYIYKKI